MVARTALPVALPMAAMGGEIERNRRGERSGDEARAESLELVEVS